MSFEFRYSAQSGKWQTVENSFPAPGKAERKELANGTTAAGLKVATSRDTNSQSIILYDKSGHVYAAKIATDLTELVPYPLVFKPTAEDDPKVPKVYDIIVPFFVLEKSASFVSQYGDATFGPARTQYLLGYREASGLVDLIELPSLTIKPYHAFLPGIKRIEALPLLGINSAGKDEAYVYFLIVTDTSVGVYCFSKEADFSAATIQPPYFFDIAGVTSATSLVLLDKHLVPPHAHVFVFDPKDYKALGFFLLSKGGNVEILRVDAGKGQHKVTHSSQHLVDPSFTLVGTFTPESLEKKTFVTIDVGDETRFYEVHPTVDSLSFGPHTTTTNEFKEQQVSSIQIIKYINDNTGIRNEIVRGLLEAAELEHILMVQYIYAAMSLKTRLEEFTHPTRKYRQFERVRTWKRQIMSIASEEMRHLAYVQGLLISVSGAAHLLRAELPNAHSYFPPGNTLMALQRFNPTTLVRFIKFERPNSTDNDRHYKDIQAAIGTPFSLLFDDDNIDAQHWMPKPESRALYSAMMAMTAPLTPEDPEYTSIGQLYDTLKDAIRDDLFISTHEPLLNVSYVQLLRRTMEAKRLNLFFPTTANNFRKIIDQIVSEGEGWPEGKDPAPHIRSHYERFLQVMREFAEERREDPDFDPARPVISNPALFKSRQVQFNSASTPDQLFNPTYQSVMLKNKTSAAMLANHVISTKLVDLINIAYDAMLTWLSQVFAGSGPKNDYEAAATMAFFPYMSEVVMPLGDLLTEISATLVQTPPVNRLQPPEEKFKYAMHGHAPASVAIGPSFDVSEAAHLITIDKTARYIQLERFDSMRTLASEILSLMQAPQSGVPPHIISNLKFVAESLRVAAQEFEYRTVHPKWPAVPYMPSGDLDPLASFTKQEIGEYCELANVTGTGAEKPVKVEKNLQTFEKTFHGLKLSFSGWLNCRLGTDPDWSNHQIGATGNSLVFCDELDRKDPPYLDRVLRFNLSEEERNKYERSFGQHVEVKVRKAEKFENGHSTPVDGFTDAEVNLEKHENQGPVYVGRNYLVAYDGEPIHPFIISVKSPKDASHNFYVQRSVKQKRKGQASNVSMEEMTTFERSLLGRWPYALSLRSDEENIAEIGKELFPKNDKGECITTSKDYILYKVSKLEAKLAELKAAGKEFSAEYEAINFRIHDIKSQMYIDGEPKYSLIVKWMRYQYFCNYCHHVSGPYEQNGALPFQGEIDWADRWIVKYDAFVYDSDSLNHFIRGDIYIPLKK